MLGSPGRGGTGERELVGALNRTPEPPGGLKARSGHQVFDEMTIDWVAATGRDRSGAQHEREGKRRDQRNARGDELLHGQPSCWSTLSRRRSILLLGARRIQTPQRPF